MRQLSIRFINMSERARLAARGASLRLQQLSESKFGDSKICVVKEPFCCVLQQGTAAAKTRSA